MKILDSLDGLGGLDGLGRSDAAAGCAVAVGVFDGFHLGHARIVRALRAEADRLAVPACVVTFRTHPRALFTGEPTQLVTSVEHRLLLLARAGLDAAFAVDFTRDIAALSAEEFVKDVLVGRLRARALVLGHDARLGRGREADAAHVIEIARAHGVHASVVAPVLVGGAPVSSTRIREAVSAGDLDGAAGLLGRRVSVLGKAVPGRGRGRTLGFPTANLDLEHGVRPPHGVYATWACVDVCGPRGHEGPREPERLASVTNSGFRPTFVESGEPEGTAERLVEVHLLNVGEPSVIDPPADGLRGRRIEVEFVKKLRDERRFESDGALAEQIARDVAAARAVLAEDAAR